MKCVLFGITVKFFSPYFRHDTYKIVTPVKLNRSHAFVVITHKLCALFVVEHCSCIHSVYDALQMYDRTCKVLLLQGWCITNVNSGVIISPLNGYSAGNQSVSVARFLFLRLLLHTTRNGESCTEYAITDAFRWNITRCLSRIISRRRRIISWPNANVSVSMICTRSSWRARAGEKWCHKYNRLYKCYIWGVSLSCEYWDHPSCRDGKSRDFRSQALVTALVSRLMYDCKCVRLCNMQTEGLTGNIMTRLVLTSSWLSNISVNLLEALYDKRSINYRCVKCILKEFR